MVRALSGAEALERVDRDGPFDAVLTDLRMPGSSGLDLLRDLRARDANAIVFVLTAFGDAAAAGEAIRAGAHDFISKPYDLGQLRVTHRARAGAEPTGLEHARRDPRRAARVALRRADAGGPQPRHHRGDEDGGARGAEPGERADLRRDRRRQGTRGARDPSLLRPGATEVRRGQLLGARRGHARERTVRPREGRVHRRAGRPGRGSFARRTAARSSSTRSATSRRRCRSRLLRALQEHEIVPVGAEAPVQVDVRIIAATHRDLPSWCATAASARTSTTGCTSSSLTLPPLRSRRQDLPLLHRRPAARASPSGTIAARWRSIPRRRRCCSAYDWPGNVRELQNVLERALVLASQDVIGPEHLPAEIRQQDATRTVGAATRRRRAQEEPAPLLPLADVERHHVLRVLRAMDGSRERTARVLGISRRTLTRMLQRWRPDLPPE